MFTTPSSDATAMAWNWVIQSIAKFKQVDSSTLAGVVEKAPAISVDLGKDAKEMVSLRMLESLFLHGSEATVDTHSAQNDKISFDPSEYCEDILHRILEETSEPMMELERQKWNIRPFIIHKRASLPKPPMQKFKEALLEGTHPIIESFKDMSKKLTRDEMGKDIFQKTENKKSILQERCLQKSVHVEASNRGIDEDIGRKECELTIEPTKETENKKSKLQEHSLQKSDHVEASNEGIAGDIRRKEHEMIIEPTAETKNEKNELQERLLRKSDPVDASNKRIAVDIARIEEEMTKEPLEETTLLDHMEHTVPDSCEESSDHADVDHGQHQPPSSDDDDERTDIAAQKEAFLSSQYTLSQDFTSTADFSEIYVCMKCSKGGQLLVCGSNACPFRVHESCLGFAATFDENPNFFCPFCSYAHAISKYMEVKKKAALARKDLQAFLTSGVRHRPKISSKTGACLDENTSTQAGATGAKCKLDGNELAISRVKNCALPDSVHEPAHQAGMTEPPSNEKASPGSSMSSHSKRNRRQEPQYTSLTITLPRRMNLFWEKSEEEILKDGVRKFSCGDNKRIPWKKILEFGGDVFDKSRTAIDLKDKWRNMCKENTSAKRQKLENSS